MMKTRIMKFDNFYYFPSLNICIKYKNSTYNIEKYSKYVHIGRTYRKSKLLFFSNRYHRQLDSILRKCG